MAEATANLAAAAANASAAAAAAATVAAADSAAAAAAATTKLTRARAPIAPPAAAAAAAAAADRELAGAVLGAGLGGLLPALLRSSAPEVRLFSSSSSTAIAQLAVSRLAAGTQCRPISLLTACSCFLLCSCFLPPIGARRCVRGNASPRRGCAARARRRRRGASAAMGGMRRHL